MSKQTHYKVVLVQQTRLYSAFTGGLVAVEYVPGERARSPNGPLLVFDTLPNATAFIKSYKFHHGHKTMWETWECRVGNPRAVNVLLGPVTLADVSAFWEKDEYHPDFLIPAPVGTLAVDWVELTRKVS